MKQGKMQQPRHQLKGIWLAFALAGISQIAFAADEVSANASNEKSSEKDASVKDPVALKAVTVTAQRRVEDAQKAAVAVSVVNTQTITADGVRAIGDITTFVPNAAAKNPDGDGRPRWYIRGLGTGDTGAATVYPVGIYADDVFLSAPIAGGGPLFDLERIEILRGPQGTLYGKNTTAGAVNIISKKPTFDTEAYATVGIGEKSERIVSGAVGGAILDERLAGRVSVYSEERDGFGKNLTTGNSYGDVNKKAIRLQLLAQLTPNLDALLKVHAREFKGDGSNGSLPIGTYSGYTRPRGRSIGLNVDEDYKLEHEGTSLTFNWDLSGYKLTSITAYDYIRNQNFTDADYTPYESSGRSDSDNRYRQYSQEFRLASPQEDKLRWLVGTHYFKETLDSDNLRIKQPGLLANGANNQTYVPTAQSINYVYRDLNYTHKTESIALFGNVKYDFTDQFTLGAGLRWTQEKKDIDLNLNQLVNNGGTLQSSGRAGTIGSSSDDKTWEDWTWDLTPEYKVSDNLLVFFRYAKGFRSGAFNTGLSDNLSQLTLVDPEKLDSYEIGLKSNWLNNRLIANANVFYYDYKNIQVNLLTSTPNGLVTALSNGAAGKVNGAELELEAQATERLHLRAALSYLDTEFTKATTVTDFTGNSFVRSPKHVIALGGDYTFPFFNGSKLIAAGDFSYRSKEYFLVDRQSEDTLSQDAYTIGNARLTWVNRDDKISLTAFVNNFTDRKYQVHGRPNGGPGSGQYVITYGNPRFAGLNLTVRF